MGGEFGTGGRPCLKLPPHEQASPAALSALCLQPTIQHPADVRTAPTISHFPTHSCESQVMNRCPCTAKDECGELERLVTQLAAAGQLPPFPVQEDSLAAAIEASSIESW